jgi:hypothetical protein
MIGNAYKFVNMGTGGYIIKNQPDPNKPGVTEPVVIWNYALRVYQGNLLAEMPLLYQALNKKPPNVNAPVGPLNEPVNC